MTWSTFCEKRTVGWCFRTICRVKTIVSNKREHLELWWHHKMDYQTVLFSSVSNRSKTNLHSTVEQLMLKKNSSVCIRQAEALQKIHGGTICVLRTIHRKSSVATKESYNIPQKNIFFIGFHRIKGTDNRHWLPKTIKFINLAPSDWSHCWCI